jgi:hypothetical protein
MAVGVGTDPGGDADRLRVSPPGGQAGRRSTVGSQYLTVGLVRWKIKLQQYKYLKNICVLLFLKFKFIWNYTTQDFRRFLFGFLRIGLVLLSYRGYRGKADWYTTHNVDWVMTGCCHPGWSVWDFVSPIVSLGRCVPWMMRPLDNASLTDGSCYIGTDLPFAGLSRVGLQRRS